MTGKVTAFRSCPNTISWIAQGVSAPIICLSGIRRCVNQPFSSVGESAMRIQTFLAVLTGLLFTTVAQAQNSNNNNTNLNRATNTVNNIRPVAPPAVSTTTVVTPQAPPPQQMPRGGSDVQRMRTNPPPSPSH